MTGAAPQPHPEGLRALPLRWRLSLITAVLIIVALTLSGAAVVALLRNSLIQQVDDQLFSAAQSYANDVSLSPEYVCPPNQAGGPTDSQAAQPTDYFVQVELVNGCDLHVPSTTAADGSEPDIPDLPAPLGRGEEFTVSSTAGPALWRVGSYSLSTPDGLEVGTMVIAVPLESTLETIANMIKTMVLVGLAVVVAGALAGYAAVQKSLQPLRDIETAAGAVAAGDLSQRAPLQPPTTEVGRLGMSFNAMVAELERAFAERQASAARMSRFVSDASHELRTPLASIRGYGELYRMGAVPPEEVPTTIGRMEDEATRMGGLVNDLLALARLDEGRGLRLGSVDLISIASDAVADLGALDPSRRTQLIADVPVTIHADGDKIRQVVTNLVGNTVQHTPLGTPVEIAVHADGGWAVLEVRDHGPGIAPEDSARVFERFYRPDTSRTRASGGSGLGLAIVATIVAAHGGSVRHEPTPGGGATMVVHLPLAGPPGHHA